MSSYRSLPRSFHFLNGAQFFGAMNDNLFKLLLIFAMIHLKGEAASSNITAIAGAVFVLPFLMLSIPSGHLADKFSKQSITLITKYAELVIMLLSVFAFYLNNEYMLYSLLFLMSAQSAVFSPAKYGIITELVPHHKIFSANGLLTLSTYVAIIFGTFAASVSADLTGENFFYASFLCLALALIGLYCSHQIPKTKKHGLKENLRLFFILDIYRLFKVSLATPNLSICMLSSAYFLFVGSFVQLIIIPYSIETLHLSDIGAGYLFLITAIGIGLGSAIAGKCFGAYPKLNYVPLASLGIALSCFCLYLFSGSLFAVILILFALGLFGGFYLVPVECFIQISSKDSRRGQNISLTNFLGFIGVLISSAFIAYCHNILKIPSPDAFLVIAITTVIVSILSQFLLKPADYKVC